MLRPSLRLVAPLRHSPALRVIVTRRLTSSSSTPAPPTTMLAHRHVPETNELVRQRVPVPVPQTGEVLLRVQAAGLCHSDLHVLGGGYDGSPMGDNIYTMGHEIAGTAVSAHSSVTGITSGALYAVVGANPCGVCAPCRSGRDNLCNGKKEMIGLGRDGGFSEFVAVPAASLVKVPQGVTAAEASACTDALLTPYHGIKTIAKLHSDENVVVVGLGGVGLNALKIAKLFGSKVFATDLKPSALEAALEAGATAALPSADLELLLSAPDAPPVSLIIDCVGIPSTFSFSQRLAAPGGRVLLLGLHDPALEWQVAQNLVREVALLQSFWGTKKELAEVMELVAERKLNPAVEEKIMGDVRWAVGEMEAGRVTGRLAFVPETE